MFWVRFGGGGGTGGLEAGGEGCGGHGFDPGIENERF